MADQNADAKKSGYGLVIFGILYATVTMIAIYVGIEYEVKSALKIHLICAGVASIILLFLFPKGNDYTVKKEKASYIYTHLILWGGVIFFPFGEYPLLSLGALILLGISEAGYVSALTREENAKRSNDSKSKNAKITSNLALILLSIILVISVLKGTDYDTKIIDWGKNFVSSLELSKKDSTGRINSDINQKDTPINSAKQSVKFIQWRSPIEIQINHAFTTSAKGKIDFNNTSNNAVYLRINLPKSGNIVLLNGRVEETNPMKGKISGDWMQEKTGASGNYVLTMRNNKVNLVLKHNGANVGIIDIN